MFEEEIYQPEIVTLQSTDISPLMKKCVIKVFYLGENRNHSYIDKDVAMQMAKTIRGVPIVGWYREDKQDFGDHGEQMTINGDGIKITTLTRPYGFVPTDANVYFQDFMEKDELGYNVKRTYLVTEGYLWAKQFKEVESIFINDKGQSMELDDESLKGKWSEKYDLFIISDATLSKLCILGDDVEPCFEGSTISKSNFTLSKDFISEMKEMMTNFSLIIQGGTTMDKENTVLQKEIDASEENTDFTQDEEIKQDEVPAEEFKKEEKDEKEEEASEESTETDADKKEEKEKEDKEKDYALLTEKFTALQEQYNTLSAELETLKAENSVLSEFKLQVENKEKDELIKKFYMLSDEDKADVIENKSKYSLEDIEAKLSVICFRKKVNFDLEDKENFNNSIEDEKVVTTFNLIDSGNTEPDWVRAVKNYRK